MKPSLRSITAFGLTFALGAGLGIGLQAYFGISTDIGHWLPNTRLSSDASTPTAVPTAVLGASISQSAIPESLQGRLKLYILIGQSNMVGVAKVPTDVRASANIFTFGNDYRWTVANEPVDSAINQIDRVSEDPNAGFGPALSFAKTLVSQDSDQIIGLIPCAREGSSITDWQKSLSDQTLYGSCLKRVRAASLMGTVSGILFFQGEADTIDPQQYPTLNPQAEAWAEKFATFAYNFRTDIGYPNLPLVYAQLGQPKDLEGLPNWGVVQAQQASIQIPNGAMIATDDLAMDGLYFTVDSYKTIGERFAAAIATIPTNPNNPYGESPSPESAQ